MRRRAAATAVVPLLVCADGFGDWQSSGPESWRALSPLRASKAAGRGCSTALETDRWSDRCRERCSRTSGLHWACCAGAAPRLRPAGGLGRLHVQRFHSPAAKRLLGSAQAPCAMSGFLLLEPGPGEACWWSQLHIWTLQAATQRAAAFNRACSSPPLAATRRHRRPATWLDVPCFLAAAVAPDDPHQRGDSALFDAHGLSNIVSSGRLAARAPSRAARQTPQPLLTPSASFAAPPSTCAGAARAERAPAGGGLPEQDPVLRRLAAQGHCVRSGTDGQPDAFQRQPRVPPAACQRAAGGLHAAAWWLRTQ